MTFGDRLSSMRAEEPRHGRSTLAAASLALAMLAGCGGAEPAPGAAIATAHRPRAIPDPVGRIYVSTSGDDGADGASPDTALRSLEAALARARDGRGDRVLLRAGDVFDAAAPVRMNVSGTGPGHPFVLGAHGVGPRPILRTRGEVALWIAADAPVSHVVVRGLALEEVRSLEEVGEGISEGIRVVAPDGARSTARDLALEDVAIRGYGVGINALGGNTQEGIRGMRVERALVLDTAHSRNAIGMLFSRVDGLALETVVVDGVQRRQGAHADVFDHSVYVQTDCSDVSVRGSIFARAPDGVMQRAGGALEDNLVVDVAIGALEGYVFAGATPTPGGVTFRAERNVLLDLGDLSPELGRGIGMYVGNVRSGVIRENVIARSRAASPWSGLALALMGETNEGNVGVLELSIEGNTIVGMPTTLRLAGTTFGSVRFEGNTTGAPLGGTPFASLDSEVPFVIASHGALDPVDAWSVAVGHRETPFSQWLAGREAPRPATLIDPTRDVAGYHASLGGERSLEAFLSAVRAQSGDGWREELSGRAASAWIREGLRPRGP